MPSTPNFTLTADTRRVAVAITNIGTVDHNEIWRSTPGEYSGAFILISNLVGQGGTFYDYNTASSVAYSYYVVAVDAGGGRAATAPASVTLTLSNTSIHAVKPKNSATTNAQNDAYYQQIGETQDYARDEQLYSLVNASLPTLGVGGIDTDSVALTIRVPTATDSVRATLRSAYASRLFLCLRDVLGNKWFGRLSSFGESYSHGYIDLNLTFSVCDYTESVT